MSERRGSRCGKCYWALYDGEFCQNSKCDQFDLSISDVVYLTKEEAKILIDEKERSIKLKKI